MKRSFPVVDADGHVIERGGELKEFLPAPYCRRGEKARKSEMAQDVDR